MEFAIQARASELGGQWPRAIRDYAFMQMSNPDDLESRLKLAHAEVRRWKGYDALTSLEEATNLPAPRGSDPRIMFEHAYALEQLGSFPEERDAALKAIESAPQDGGPAGRGRR